MVILRFGEKRFHPFLPMSLLHLGLNKSMCSYPNVETMLNEQLALVTDMFSDGIPETWSKYIDRQSGERLDDLSEAIVDLIEKSYLQLCRIETSVGRRMDRTIIIQREFSPISSRKNTVVVGGMAYSSDPYGEDIEDYGMYWQSYPPGNKRQRDLSDLRSEFPIHFRSLRRYLDIIDGEYREPRYVEYNLVDSDVWLLQNRRRWRTSKDIVSPL